MVDILKEVLKNIPEKVEISGAVFEAANIVLYTKSRDFFLDNNGVIKEIVDKIKKRVEVRMDPSMTMDLEDAEKEIRTVLTDEIGKLNILFDPQRSQVVIEAEKPGLVIGKSGEVLKEIKKRCLWVPLVKRIPALRSKLIENIRQVLYENNDYRKTFLHKVGERIYAGWDQGKKEEWIRVTFLGGARQVGRSCLYLQTPESHILLDCGTDIATSDKDAYPYFDAPEFNLNDLDAVIITHPHLDHCLPPDSPVLTANGYKRIDDINIGEKIISVDWKTGKYNNAECKGKTRTFEHNKIFKITTPYSNIEASPNHKFFIVQDMEIKEVRADQLNKNILLPSVVLHKPKLMLKSEKSKKIIELDTHVEYNARKKDNTTLPKILSSELAEFLGYYMGDGHKSSEFSLRLTDHSKQLLHHYKKLIKSVFNFNSKIRHHPDKTKDACILEINNVKIIRFLEKNFPEAFLKANHISAPEKIKNSSFSAQKSFIRGFADAEGTVTNRIKITTSSNKMIEDIKTMLSLQGIPSYIAQDTKVCKAICLSSKFSMKEFKEKIGFSSVQKQQKLEKKIAGFVSTAFDKENLIPITPQDVRKVIEEAGMIGRIHNSPKILEQLPSCLWDPLRGKQTYLTKQTATVLINVLENRINKLTSMKSNINLYALRQILKTTRKEISIATGLKIHEIQYIEEEKIISEELVNLLSSFMNEKISLVMSKTIENIKKLKNILLAEVTWEKIKNIEEKNNPYPYLVDIEVEDYHNFIAGNLVVHNCGLVPYLYKMGYRGPVYWTLPARDISALLCLDYIGVAFKEAKKAIFSSTDVKEMVKHSVCLDYEEVCDITPDIRITFYNAGHTLGSAMAHIHIGNGLHNFLYTGDTKYARTKLLEPAVTKFPRLETLTLEATYGGKDNIQPSREECEAQFVEVVKRTIERKGKILVPVLGVGRAQEMMLVIEELIRNKTLPEIPVFVQGMVWDITAIHTAYPDFLNNKIKKAIFQYDNNPFLSSIFKQVGSVKERQQVIEETGSCLILATSGMLSGGASVEFFRELADNPKNTLIFVSYQGEGSLGRRVQSGEKEFLMDAPEGRKENVHVKMEIITLEGLSGHSSRNELTRFVYNLEPRPKKIIIIHGESSRCLDLASTIHKLNRIETNAPKNLEAIRIR